MAKRKSTENPDDVSLFDALAPESEEENEKAAGAEEADAAAAEDVEETADALDEADAADEEEPEAAEDGGDDGGNDDEAGDEDNGGDEPQEEASAAETMQDIMGGDVEEDGSLTLARYASRAYLEYAMSVVKDRALPDVGDGQKPVQRRILIDMECMGVKAGAKAVKSARVVGDVLGKYHPHGDMSVYDAMVRMAQNFSLRYPLVDGEGNFGSRDGDSQAAMRYTEARLMPIAQLLLDEVDSGAVDFTPNYDGNFKEPVVLPAKLPFVLLNGASGIAVGMATDIPSHNLREVAAACELLIDKPEATLDEVLEVLPGPDFPCGGQIISPKSVIRDIYATGRGRLVVRARYHFEDMARGQWQLVVDELPPAASSQLVLNQIEAITNPRPPKGKKTVSAKLLQAKSAMLSILDLVRDESGEGKPVRLVFEPKTSKVDRREFVKALLSQTAMESNVSVNLVMLGIDGKPKQKSLLEILNEWIAFRLQAVRRRSQARLDKVLDRIHVLEGRSMVLLHIDRVIEIIRASDDPKAALIKEFGLSERQADDILEIRLRQLARLAGIAIEKELSELNREKNGLERILGSEAVLRRTVSKEIAQAAKDFGDDRRTLIKEAEEVVSEVRVVDEPVTVVLSKKGFVRSRQGHGHDCTLLSYRVGDEFDQSIECRSVDDLSLLTDTGRVYTVKVTAIPGGRGDGVPISSLIDLDKESNGFPAMFAGHEKRDVVLATSDAMGFICAEGDMKSSQRVGRTFVKTAQGQRVLKPAVGLPEQNLLACLSERGRLLVFPADELRRLPKGGMGVALMKLEPGEKLLEAVLVDSRGLIATGTGRGGKPREVSITKSTFEGFVMHRARKGRAIAVSWQVEHIRPLPSEEAQGASGDGGDGLVISLEDENPRLI